MLDLLGAPAPLVVSARLLGRLPAEDGLAQAQLERFDDGAAGDDAGVGAAGVELADHVGVDAHGGLAGPGEGRRLLLELAVDGEGGAPEGARGEGVAGLGARKHLESVIGKAVILQ